MLTLLLVLKEPASFDSHPHAEEPRSAASRRGAPEARGWLLRMRAGVSKGEAPAPPMRTNALAASPSRRAFGAPQDEAERGLVVSACRSPAPAPWRIFPPPAGSARGWHAPPSGNPSTARRDGTRR